MRRVAGWLLAGAFVTHVGLAGAAEKPDEIVIGITTFSSGPASVFGVPANAAAEMLDRRPERARAASTACRLVPIFIDEGAGGEHAGLGVPPRGPGRRARR